MNRVWGKALVVAGLILMMGGVSSWGAAPPNIIESDADENTAGGTDALQSNTTGSDNTAIGSDALERNIDGTGNTAIGDNALMNSVLGDNNTASGFGALRGNTIGNNNTAVGVSALQNNDDDFNTAVGINALHDHIIGQFNTAVGINALQMNPAATTTTPFNNTAVGARALQSNTGSGNTAVGNNALQNTTGNNNVAIGQNAGLAFGGPNFSQVPLTGSDNIYLGTTVDVDPNESQTMRLGNTSTIGGQTRTFIAGIAGATVSNSAPVLIDTSTGRLGTQVSSARYKRDIQPMGAHSQGLLQLRPVIFRYQQDVQGERQYGLIAEEVAKVYPELVTRGATGEVEAVRYHEVIPMLLNEVQNQQRQLAELKAQNESLRVTLVQQNAELAARLARLEEGAARAAALTSR